jgi:hypothetical protein
MPLPSARDLNAALELQLPVKTHYGDAYRNRNITGAAAGDTDVISEIQPNEAERIAQASMVPQSGTYQEPASLMGDLDTTGVAARARPVSAPMPTESGVVAMPVSAPVAAAPVASATQLSSVMTPTPNYYLGGGLLSQGTPVNYGVATGGMAPAGTVTPDGHVVGTAAPAAGAKGGGGTPPAGGMTDAMKGMLLQTALSSLSGAASNYAASEAQPDATLGPIALPSYQVPYQPLTYGQHTVKG